MTSWEAVPICLWRMHNSPKSSGTIYPPHLIGSKDCIEELRTLMTDWSRIKLMVQMDKNRIFVWETQYFYNKKMFTTLLLTINILKPRLFHLIILNHITIVLSVCHKTAYNNFYYNELKNTRIINVKTTAHILIFHTQ